MDRLAGEVDGPSAVQRRADVELGELGADALGGPAGAPGRHRPLGVDRFVQDGEQRGGGEGEVALHGLEEGFRQFGAGGAGHPRVLDQVVQDVRAGAGPQHPAEPLERLRRQQPAAGQPRRVFPQVRGDTADALDVLRVARVVRGVLAGHPRVRGPVDVLGRGPQPRQTAGDHDLAQALGRVREIGRGAEAAEALPQDAPPRVGAGQFAAEQLGVPHDRVGAETRQIIGLFTRAAAQRQGLPVGRRGTAGAPLVQQQHPVVVQRARQPGGPARRTRRRVAGAALEVDQPGQFLVLPAGRHGFAPVHRQPLTVRHGVVQRHVQEVVGQYDTGQPVGPHDCSLVLFGPAPLRSPPDRAAPTGRRAIRPDGRLPRRKAKG